MSLVGSRPDSYIETLVYVILPPLLLAAINLKDCSGLGRNLSLLPLSKIAEGNMIRGMLGHVLNKLLKFGLLLSSNDCSMHAQKKAISFHICDFYHRCTYTCWVIHVCLFTSSHEGIYLAILSLQQVF